MSQPIVYIDTSDIRDGKLEELKASIKHLTAFVKANVPRIISYAFYLNTERKRMSVVSVHPDSACLKFHMDTGNEEFRKFSNLIRLLKIEIYGNVSDEILQRLYKKAEMLGSGEVLVYPYYAGFFRHSAGL